MSLFDSEGCHTNVKDGAKSTYPKHSKQRAAFEHRQGCEIWRQCFTDVTSLSLNMRTVGVLAAILDGMRKKQINDKCWQALKERLLGTYKDEKGSICSLPSGVSDPRLDEPPFSTNTTHYIVHRHKLRACQSFRNVRAQCMNMKTKFYVGTYSRVN